MSKIFRISGNFVQFGEWAEPDPSFSGEIVVDEDGVFYGFCDELYEGDAGPDINRVRYLSGAFGPNGYNGQQGIAFYKMSNYALQSPLMYVAPDLNNTYSGGWYAMDRLGVNFMLQGIAKVFVEEEEYSKEKEISIKTKFGLLNTGINYHDILLEMARTYCKEALFNTE